MTEPRTAAVEDNLMAFFAAAAESGDVLHRDPADDVVALRSDVAFPNFNAVTAARFGVDPAVRAEALADSYIADGLPWMWWLTPSTTPAGLESVLESRGLEREDVPGMYADLATSPTVPPVAGLTVEASDDVDGLVDVMLAGFDMPELVRAPMAAIMGGFPAVNVVAHLDGRPVACGTAYLDGATAGLYNIATLEDARGRGVGYAVTATLMQLAHRAGAAHAVLHATESGRPVYERAGFVKVCEVPMYVWLPSETDEG
jgi:GNAT superfamily N-acetyltransferase